jgi:GNAT superfamily N-acetyltransferase
MTIGLLETRTENAMHAPAVTTAGPAEQRQVVSTIVLAFARDPITRWVWRHPHDYLTHFPPFVETFGGRAFAHGSAHRTLDALGAALWLPPDVHPDESTMRSLIESSVAPAIVPTVFRLFEEMGRYHPTEPHWYLPLIGVEPLAQGRGHGSALLQHALEKIDREGQVAYLESTNPMNIPLYRRHGFEVLGTIQVGDAPAMVPMVRRAR